MMRLIRSLEVKFAQFVEQGLLGTQSFHLARIVKMDWFKLVKDVMQELKMDALLTAQLLKQTSPALQEVQLLLLSVHAFLDTPQADHCVYQPVEMVSYSDLKSVTLEPHQAVSLIALLLRLTSPVLLEALLPHLFAHVLPDSHSLGPLVFPLAEMGL
jgi:hypothetical protein